MFPIIVAIIIVIVINRFILNFGLKIVVSIVKLGYHRDF